MGKHGGGSGGGEKVEGLLCAGLDLRLCLSLHPSLKEVLRVETKLRLSSLSALTFQLYPIYQNACCTNTWPVQTCTFP